MNIVLFLNQKKNTIAHETEPQNNHRSGNNMNKCFFVTHSGFDSKSLSCKLEKSFRPFQHASMLMQSACSHYNGRVSSRELKNIVQCKLVVNKGGFFSESAIRFFKSPNLQKKYSKKLS